MTANRLLKGHFVRVASPESIKAGKVSLLACAETFVSVALMGLAAWYFNPALFTEIGGIGCVRLKVL